MGATESKSAGLRGRYVRAYAALLVVFLIAALAVSLAVGARTRAVDEEADVWRPGQVAASDLLTAVVDQEAGQRGFVITGQESLLEPYDSGRQRAAVAVATLNRLFADDADIAPVLAATQASLTAWQQQAAEPLIAEARRDLEAAQASVAAVGGKQLVDRFRADHAELAAAVDRGFVRAEERHNDAFTGLLITVTVAGLIFLGAGTWVLRRSQGWLRERQQLLDREHRLRLDHTTAADELERIATLLHAVIGAAPVGIAVFDPQMRFLHINDALAARNGLDVNDHIGHTPAELFLPDIANEIESMFHGAVAGTPTLDQLIETEADGNPIRSSVLLVSYFPIHTATGQLVAVGSTTVDVTEQQRTASALRETGALLDTLIEESPIGFAFFDLDWRYQRINRALAEMNRLPADAAIGRTIDDVLPELAETFTPILEQVAANRRPVRDIEIISATTAAVGATRQWLSGFFPVEDTHGHLIGVGVASLEITQLRTIEQHLRHIIETLQASLLPTDIPTIDGVTVAVRYHPASDDMDVGGDFYDIVTRADGTVAVSIGDVCGHDVHAAVITAVVRHIISAAAQHLTDPIEILQWANHAVLANSRDGRFVTAAHAHLHPAHEHSPARLRLALAGHPQPILIPADGSAPTELGAPGTLLGLDNTPKFTTTDVELQPGDQLLLYTDGLTENTIPRLTTDQLLQLVHTARGPTAHDTATNLVHEYEITPRRPSLDDVAILILQRNPPTTPSSNDRLRSLGDHQR